MSDLTHLYYILFSQDDVELLKWTMTLDFDEYTKDWRTMATSMPSDADRKKLYSVAAGLNIGNY